MLRASLLRLPVVVTFLNSAALGVVLALLNNYYYSVLDVKIRHSHFASDRLNGSSRIALQLWHSHNMVCMHVIV